MKTTKRIISIFLTVLMVLTIAPLSGFANTDWSELFSFEASALRIWSLTYTIDNGEITITDCKESESGELYIPYSIDGNRVTCVGDSAFKNCTKLTSVTIPNSVTSIGSNAFYGCYSLTGITIPNSVTSIGNRAFCGCEKITSITIPDSVTSIGDYAFCGCKSITSITIPEGVTSIGRYAFSDTAFYNDSSNWEEGALYIGNRLITVKSSSGTYEIKNGTWFIADYAFGYSAYKTITIPDSVTSIGDYAFQGCKSLTSITIPDSVTSMGNFTFQYCSNLTSITIPDSVTSIGNYSFDECTSLESVIIPDSVKSIGHHAFDHCMFTSITIPNSVTNIGNGAFYNCDNLTSITIPDSVISISEDTFYLCTGLTSITIGNGVTSIGDDAFYSCDNLTSITIPDSVTTIGDSAFSQCKKLTSITIPNSVTSIGFCIFYGCNNLTSISVDENNSYCDSRDNCNAIIETATNTLISSCKNTIIPDSVTNIGENAFNGCNLTSITIPDSVTSIGKKAFSGFDNLTSVTIPNSITSIGEYAFYSCDNLTSIVIPDSVTSIGEYAFAYCSSLTSMTIPNSVTSIGKYAFCGGITNIIFADGISEIPDNALYSANKVESVIIPSSVTSIGSYAFAYCSSLTNITIPESVTSIASYAFAYCSSLTNITILSHNRSLGSYIFKNCTSLKNVTLSDNFGAIGYYMFQNCTSLTNITLPKNCHYILDYAFENCKSLTSITFPEVSFEIDEYAFQNCTALTSVTITNCTIKEGAFSGCSNIESMTLPRVGVNDLRYGAEYPFGYIFGTEIYTGSYAANQEHYKVTGHTGFTTYYIPSKLKSVTITGGSSNGELKYGAFMNCSSIISVTLSDDYRYIDDCAFYGCSRLKNITRSNGGGFYKIGNYAFCGCYSLESFTFSSYCDSIGNSAFSSCKSLTSITIPDSVTSIGAFAFMNCTSLTSINIPYSITSICGGVFSYCSSLTSITIPESVTEIGYVAFEGCSSLTSIIIPKSVISIGDRAFENCRSLNSIEILNKNCTIIDEKEANYEEDTIPKNAQICGYPGSTARYYAKRHNRTIKYIIDPEVYYPYSNYYKSNIYTYSTLESASFYQYTDWENEGTTRYTAFKTWDYIENIGEIANFQFDDLTITGNIYDTFVSDLLLQTYSADSTFDELNVKVLKQSESFNDKFISIFKTSEEWQSYADKKGLINGIKKFLADPKNYKLTSEQEKILRKFFKNSEHAKYIFSGCDCVDKFLNCINAGTDFVNCFIKAVNAYNLAFVVEQSEDEFYNVMDNAISEMRSVNYSYAQKLSSVVSKYKSQSNSISPYSEFLSTLVGQVALFDYNYMGKTVVKTYFCKVVAHFFGASAITPFMAISLSYNLTTSLWGQVTRLDKKKNPYYYIYFTASFEEGLRRYLEQLDAQYQSCSDDDYLNEHADNLAQKLYYGIGMWADTNYLIYSQAEAYDSACWFAKDSKALSTEKKAFWESVACHLDKIDHDIKKIIRINCPVDVYVYDEDGNLVTLIQDEKIVISSPLVSVNAFNEHKIIGLPDDTYSIVVKAYDEGTLDYSVTSIDTGETYQSNDISIEKDDVFDVENSAEESEMNLVSDGETIPFDYDSTVATCTEHDYGDPELIEGRNVYTCKVCNYRMYEIVDDHTDIIQVYDVAPTCTSEGHYNNVCSQCGKLISEGGTVAALDHNYVVTEKAATCTSEGYHIEKCENCGDVKISQTIEKIDHEYQDVVTEPTCLEQGYTEHICIECGYSYTDTYIDALGHSFTNYVLNNNATCTKDGTKTAKCDRCSKTDTVTIAGTALGHSFTNYISDDNATCTEDGTKTAKCDRCDVTDTIADTGSALGHDLVKVESKEPTCTEAGNNEYYKCSRCDKAFKDAEVTTETEVSDEEIAALGHSFINYVSDNNATCTEDGTKTARCDRCDVTDTVKDADTALGHSFTNYISDNNATCTEDGTKTAKCDRCDVTDTVADTGSVLGHDLVKVEAKEPTCTEAGNNEYYKCSRCDKAFKDAEGTTETEVSDEEIAALGHSFINYVSDNNATCTEDGTKTARCDRCDVTDTVKDADTALGHSFTSYISDNNATCTEDGTKTAKCDHCSKTDTVADTGSALGHDLVKVEAKEPTCTEAGNNEYYKCSRCDKTFKNAEGTTETKVSDEEIAALGHSFTNYISDDNATCTEDGTKTAKCDRCNATYTVKDANSALDHNYTIFVTSPTCTEDGYLIHICSLCGDSYRTDIISALGHTPTDAVTENEVEATYFKNGSYDTVVYCSVCGAELSRETTEIESAILEYTIENDVVIITGCDESVSGELVIPDTVDGCPVTTIDDSAFANCSNLTGVTIPDTVTSIGSGAFYNCSGLTSVDISNGVTTIKTAAFRNCTNLSSITIPASVTSIGFETFEGCSNLTNISVDEKNTVYDSRDNCNAIIETSTNELIQGCATSIIPDDTASISDCAFSGCTNLKSIVIPSGVTSIGSGAFEDCIGLSNITVSDTVTSIGSDAFKGTAFYDDESNWESNVLYIGNYLIKANDSISGSYEIKSRTKIIADEAFSNCINLTSVTVPDSVTSIGRDAFSGCTGLTSIVIPDSVISIGGCAFDDCANLVSITIPDTVTDIGYSAFEGTAYYNDESNWDNGVLYIGNHLIKAKDSISGSYAVKSGTVTVANSAFMRCSDLTGISIPASVTSINSGSICGCSGLTTITVDENNTVYDSRDYCDAIIETATNKLVCGCNTTVIPSSVTSIGDYAFILCSGIENIVIPNSVTSIGEFVFLGCQNLTEVTLTNSVTKIGEAAFNVCESLTDVIYYGTAKQFAAIDIEGGNENFTKATVQYNVKYDIPDNLITLTAESSSEYPWLTEETVGLGLDFKYDTDTQIVYVFAAEEGILGKAEAGDFLLAFNINTLDGFINENIYGNTLDIDTIVYEIMAYYLRYPIPSDDKLVTLTTEPSTEYPWLLMDLMAEAGICVKYAPETKIIYCFETSQNDDGDTVTGNIIFNYNFDCEFNENYGISFYVNPPVPSVEAKTVYKNKADCSCVCTDWYLTDEYADEFVDEEGYDEDGTYNSVKYTVKVYETEKGNYLYLTLTLTSGDSTETQGLGAYIDSTRFNMLYEGEELLVAPSGHNYVSVVTEPTSESDGYTIHTCSNCGDSYKDSVVPATGHNYVPVVTEPTCTTDGFTTYTCTICNDSYISDTVPTTGHTSDNGTVTKEATCTEMGIKTYKCTVCNNVIKTEEIQALGHSEETIPAVEATCTKSGLTDGKKCSVCGEILTAQTEIPVAAHTPANAVKENETAATCTEEGSYDSVVYCSVCKSELSREAKTVAALDHTSDNGTITTEATCTTDGLKTYKCTVCGETLKTEEISALGHKEEIIPSVAATCTKLGLTEGKKCSVCGETLTSQTEIPATGHNYVSLVTEPTCTTEGYTTHTCTSCGDSYTDEIVSATGHTSDKGTVTKVATCTDNGIRTFKCIDCGETLKTEEIAALGHDEINHDAKASTCSKAGCEAYVTCSRCDYTTYKEIAPLEHKPDDGSVTKEPTCTENGEKTYLCTVCGDVVKTEEIAATGHDYNADGVCTLCGAEEPENAASRFFDFIIFILLIIKMIVSVLASL